MDDCDTAAIRFENGALGTFQGATCIHGGLPARIEVHGERGNVIIEGDRIVHWRIEGEPEESGAATDASGAADPKAGLGNAVEAHAEQIADVLSAIEEGREPAISGAEARRAVEVILGIYHSAWSGETIHFPLLHDPLPPAVL